MNSSGYKANHLHEVGKHTDGPNGLAIELTVGYARPHPVSQGESSGALSAGFPGTFSCRLPRRSGEEKERERKRKKEKERERK